MNFYEETIKGDFRFHSRKRIADMGLLEPVTREAVQAILTEAETMGIPCMVFETYRSRERQADLYEQGVTRLRNVGVHHYGLAADIVKVVDGEPSWDGSFQFLLELARKHGLISGIDWGRPDIEHTFIDQCHVQRIKVSDQEDLFSGDWYPDRGYNPYDPV